MGTTRTKPRWCVFGALLGIFAAGCATQGGVNIGFAEDTADFEDLSRAEILYIASGEYSLKQLPLKFVLPTDRLEGREFGIDVSHHNGAVDWSTVSRSGVDFVYLKASQGASIVDRRFSINWASLGAIGSDKIKRGAYHFFSPLSTPNAQAENFIAQIGNQRADDLPPVVDLEWDFKKENGQIAYDEQGRAIDRWADVAPQDIVRRTQIFLSLVEASTGKKPIIYTNGNWWRQRVGAAGDQLKSYKIWIADYSKASLTTERPSFVMDGFDWQYWQFTEHGRIVGASGKFDINIAAP